MCSNNRVILLIDMDCFYCQVEEDLNPSLRGKPIAVVQHNQWRGGGIIAVNYPARDRGVRRQMRGQEAQEHCPDIALVQVPVVRGKADLMKYREAGKKVADVLQTFTPFLERASIDEAYLDITREVEKRISEKNERPTVKTMRNTHVVGYSVDNFISNVIESKMMDANNYRLAVGGVIAEEIRAEVLKVTGYTCSAGIAHNKILAKLGCGLNKPNKQTIIPSDSVSDFFEMLPIHKIKNLGGKFGNAVKEKLNVAFLGQLSRITIRELMNKFDQKSANFLYNIAQGIDNEPVQTRLLAKSIACSKQFSGKMALLKQDEIEHWLLQLSEEISERLMNDLKENNREARHIIINFGTENEKEIVNHSRSRPLSSYQPASIYQEALKVIKKSCLEIDGSYKLTHIGLNANQFHDLKNVKKITAFFKNMTEKKSTVSKNFANELADFPEVDKKSLLRGSSKICDISFSYSTPAEEENDKSDDQQSLENVSNDINTSTNYHDDSDEISVTMLDNDDCDCSIYSQTTDSVSDTSNSEFIIYENFACTSIYENVDGSDESIDSITHELAWEHPSDISHFGQYFHSSPNFDSFKNLYNQEETSIFDSVTSDAVKIESNESGCM